MKYNLAAETLRQSAGEEQGEWKYIRPTVVSTDRKTKQTDRQMERNRMMTRRPRIAY